MLLPPDSGIHSIYIQLFITHSLPQSIQWMNTHTAIHTNTQRDSQPDEYKILSTQTLIRIAFNL